MQGRSFRQVNICIDDFKRLRLTALGGKVGKGWDGDGQKRVHLMGGGGGYQGLHRDPED